MTEMMYIARCLSNMKDIYLYLVGILFPVCCTFPLQ
jgi:hypothetical protein